VHIFYEAKIVSIAVLQY